MVKPCPSDPEERRQYEQDFYENIDKWGQRFPVALLVLVLLVSVVFFLE